MVVRQHVSLRVRSKTECLVKSGFPAREGTNPSGQKDSNGKAFHDEFLKVVQTKGSGWVDYMFPKPGQTHPSQKWSYVKGVKIDGTPAIIWCGFLSRVREPSREILVVV